MADDEFAAVNAIRDAVPTSRHAGMLFDMVTGLFGSHAHVETSNGGKRRSLFVRDLIDAARIVPWPVLRQGLDGRLSTIMAIVGSGEAPPRPGKAPRLRGLGPGEIVVHDGPHAVTVTYGDDGRWLETSVSIDQMALGGAIAAIARGGGRPVELLADHLAGLDAARHGPGRVHLPVPLPGGVPSAWWNGLSACRDAVFTDTVPHDARWIVADGYAGTALAWGATEADALAAWRAKVAEEQPRPPPPAAPPPPKQELKTRPGQFEASMTIAGPKSDVPQPDPAPENTPAMLIPLAPPPDRPPPWGQWVRLLGTHGTTIHAALRQDPDGFTLVGDQLLDRMDFARLDAQLDQVPRHPWPDAPAEFAATRPKARVELAHFETDGDAFSCNATSRTEAFAPHMLNGDQVRDRVVRLRRLGG